MSSDNAGDQDREIWHVDLHTVAAKWHVTIGLDEWVLFGQGGEGAQGELCEVFANLVCFFAVDLPY